MVAAPTPTSVPNAVEMFIRGKVTARPAMLSDPTSAIWPMYTLSTILYSEDAVMAMMPGTAYWRISALMGLVPSSVGTAPVLILSQSPLQT